MVNKTVIQGRLVADPELRQTSNGTAVCGFRIAWSDRYGESEKKLFLGCTAWRNTAEFVAKYFTKGREILLEGSLEMREWQAKDGSNRQTVELNVDRAHFCGSKSDSDGGVNSPSPAPSPAQQYLDDDDDDEALPF